MTHTHRPFDNALAGAIGGMIAVTGSYPFDLIKTRLHFEVGKAKGTGLTNPTISTISKTIWAEGFQKGFLGIKPLGGLLGFYRGLDQLIPESALKVLVRFYAFKELQEYYKNHIASDPNGRVGFLVHLTCGAMAGAIEGLIVVQPFERGKVLRADFASPWVVFSKAFRDYGFVGGVKTIYTGVIPTMGRQIGNQAVSFSVFYGIKDYVLKDRDAKDLANWERIVYGFISGCVGATTTMPLDVAKSIAQKQQGLQTLGTFTILRNVYNKSGFTGLYTGLAPRLGRVGIDRALNFWAFELIVAQLAAWRGDT
eukprot:TRINITY_DN345_c0_g1_i1.p1 TRINITY_DN345_c0_g1~~TRINITY_DN345_c0_g1_i1.p1  ORF type:complete len:310 (+),score=60.52 TRINITY_DN345_c0_g1_i1:79-1008(+)